MLLSRILTVLVKTQTTFSNPALVDWDKAFAAASAVASVAGRVQWHNMGLAYVIATIVRPE